MTRQTLRQWSTITTILLAGCSSSPATKIFTIGFVPPQTARPAVLRTGSVIAVGAVRMPREFDRTEVVTPGLAHELKVDDFSHWGAPVAELVRRALVQDMSARMPGRQVVPADLAGLAFDSLVTVDVLSISEGNGRMLVDADWVISNADGSRRRLNSARLSVISAGNGSAATATDITAVVAEMADEIVAELDPRP